MFHFCFKRSFYKFSKTDTFENLLPLKSETYFKQFIKDKQTFYLGFDPTANSLQIGNLFPLIALLRVWKSGHNIIALIGGATGQIGDPTDRVSDRDQLPNDLVNSFGNSISKDIQRIINNFQSNFITNEPLGSFKLLNNIDWYEEKNMIYFITKIMKHFRFHDIRNKRSFESRLSSQSTLNMSEFLYPFLQAYDWLHLYQNYGCKIQIGGDDQTGNIQLGQILIKQVEKASVYGLTVPLFTIDGEKVGKSNMKSNFKLWLNADAQSPYSLYYSIMHVPNSLIINNGLLTRLTLLEDREIAEIMDEFKAQQKNKQMLQIILSDQVVKLVHGSEVLNTVKSFYNLFSTHVPESIQKQLLALNESKLILDNISSVPHISINTNQDQTVTINQLIQAASLDTHSLTTVKFNGETVTDLSRPIITSSNMNSVLKNKICGVLQIGTRNDILLRIEDNKRSRNWSII